MDAVGFISRHWLEITVAVYLLGMILYGHYKGFIRLVVSALALIITLFAVRVTMPYATDWLKKETSFYQMIQSSMEKAVGLEDILNEEGPGDGNPGENSNEAGAYGPGQSGGPDSAKEAGKTPSWERKIIEDLKLPVQLKQALVENNNGEVYRALGVELFRDYIGSYLTNLIVQIVVFLVLFLVIFVLLHILVAWLDLMARLPILSGMNKIAGAILGGVEALFFIWIACLIFTALSGTGIGILIMEQIDASVWLSYLYHNNLLAQIALSVIQLVI